MMFQGKKSSSGEEEREKPNEIQQEQLNPIETVQVNAAGAVEPIQEDAPPGKMKIDLHAHTEASLDCSTPLKLIPAKCISKKIRIQAITDHNTISGAVHIKKMVDETMDPSQLTVIIGEEIMTQEGEIVGLFLQEAIPDNLTPQESVKAIKDQGGLVLLPHGFDPMKRWRLQSPALEQIASQVDIVETFNARISNLKWNRLAVDWAKEHEKLMSAGTDAHRLSDIGSAWVEVPAISVHTPQDLLSILKGGTPVGKWIHPALAYVLKMIDRSKHAAFHKK